jgi:hypothetical protein
LELYTSLKLKGPNKVSQFRNIRVRVFSIPATVPIDNLDVLHL